MSDAVAEIADGLAGLASVEVRRPGRLARVVGLAVAGRPVGVELAVHDLDGPRRPFVVGLPDVADLVTPAVTEAIVTTIGVRRRFPDHLRDFKRISFDHSDAALAAGSLAGHAVANRSTIHLNASYVTEAEAAALVERSGRDALLPMKRLVAHELWHLVELTWEVRDYAATIEFRRRLGEHFGVATLERALVDPHARLRLVSDVSAYAAAGRLEATAEMFERWWNEGPVTAALHAFGDLVARFLPHPGA